jgi:N-acetylmuramoyl-L-alanine amidase
MEDNCNVNKFYELNNLKETTPLVEGKNYFLPVYIYKYDGRSIRSTVGINDWDKAVTIKEYNELILKLGLRTTHYSDSKLLWVPFHSINCKSNDLTSATINSTTSTTLKPKEANKIYNPIFGKKYAEITLADKSLKNKVYYVVSGHGGPDPGAMCNTCPTSLCEDEYAYDVAIRLARNLMQHGATVHLVIQDKNDGIRDDDLLHCDKDEKCEGKSLPLNQKSRLKQRTTSINRMYDKYSKQGVKSQEAIFIHVDSRSAHKTQDVFFYHYKNSKTGKSLASKMQKTFEKKYNKHQQGRGYKGYVEGKGLYVLRNAKPTSLFVELANIRNKNDHRRLLNPSNRQALANWLFEGLINN